MRAPVLAEKTSNESVLQRLRQQWAKVQLPWQCGAPCGCIVPSRCDWEGTAPAAENIPFVDLSCDLECVVHKAAIQRTRKRSPVFGWLTGYQEFLYVEINVVGADRGVVRRTPSGSCIESMEITGTSDVNEEWVWNTGGSPHAESLQSQGRNVVYARGNEPLMFSVRLSSDVKLRLLGSSKQAMQEPSPLELLGEARFKVHEDVVAAAQVGGAMSLPIIHDSRVHGTIWMSVLLRVHSNFSPFDAKPAEAAAAMPMLPQPASFDGGRSTLSASMSAPAGPAPNGISQGYRSGLTPRISEEIGSAMQASEYAKTASRSSSDQQNESMRISGGSSDHQNGTLRLSGASSNHTDGAIRQSGGSSDHQSEGVQIANRDPSKASEDLAGVGQLGYSTSNATAASRATSRNTPMATPKSRSRTSNASASIGVPLDGDDIGIDEELEFDQAEDGERAYETGTDPNGRGNALSALSALNALSDLRGKDAGNAQSGKGKDFGMGNHNLETEAGQDTGKGKRKGKGKDPLGAVAGQDSEQGAKGMQQGAKGMQKGRGKGKGNDGHNGVELKGHTAAVTCCTVFPDGDRVLTGSEDGTGIIWSKTGSRIATLTGHQAGVVSCAIFPDGERVLTSSADDVGIVWSHSGLKPSPELNMNDLRIFSIFPDGARILAASSDEFGRIFFCATGKHIILRGHVQPIVAVAVFPTGDKVLTASLDDDAILWTAQGSTLRILRGHSAAPTRCAVFPDGDRVLTASNDATAIIWGARQDSQTYGKKIVALQGHTKPLTCATILASGEQVVTGSQDRQAILWSSNGEKLASLQGHADALSDCLAFPGASGWLLTVSRDGVGIIWSTAGRKLADLAGHSAALSSCAVSPAGDYVVTASEDKLAIVWPMDTNVDATLAATDQLMSKLKGNSR